MTGAHLFPSVNVAISVLAHAGLTASQRILTRFQVEAPIVIVLSVVGLAMGSAGQNTDTLYIVLFILAALTFLVMAPRRSMPHAK